MESYLNFDVDEQIAADRIAKRVAKERALAARLSFGNARRRLAAIPMENSQCVILRTVEIETVESSKIQYSALPLLGVIGSAIVCVGCMLKRRFFKEEDTKSTY